MTYSYDRRAAAPTLVTAIKKALPLLKEAESLAEHGARPFDQAERVMKGWLVSTPVDVKQRDLKDLLLVIGILEDEQRSHPTGSPASKALGKAREALKWVVRKVQTSESPRGDAPW